MPNSIPCTYNEFRKSAAQFFRDTNEPGLEYEQVANGNKCLGLMYLGMTDWDQLTEQQLYECVIILELSTKRECEYPYERYSN